MNRTWDLTLGLPKLQYLGSGETGWKGWGALQGEPQFVYLSQTLAELWEHRNGAWRRSLLNWTTLNSKGLGLSTYLGHYVKGKTRKAKKVKEKGE